MWYEEQRPGLGDEFLAEVSAVLARIAATPQAFPLWPGLVRTAGKIRRAVVQRFGYVVAFETHADYLLILAIAHAKRRPLYWLARG